MKTCATCRKIKMNAEFPKGRYSCRNCYNVYHVIYSKKNPDKRYKNHLKTTYGIDVSEVEKLKELQKARCAICSKRMKLGVDHEHKTGKVRGLLCNPCNLLLGWSKDDIKILAQAVKYLEKYK